MRGGVLTGSLARRASLLALGALALHQLRYALAYGDRTSAALASQGHSYLGDLGAIVVAFAASLACARLLAAGFGRLRPGRSARALPRAALALAAALLAIFAAQELSEGALSAGHPGGLAAVAANGGWLALPLALVIGLAAALADRLLAGAERRLVEGARRTRAPRPRPLPAAAPDGPDLVPPASGCLRFGLARRGPPAPAAG
jgi:hypothetical protein